MAQTVAEQLIATLASAGVLVALKEPER